MRLIRLGALVGSVVLLVAMTVSVVNERSELRREQDVRVTTAALVADQSVGNTLARAVSAVELTNDLTDGSQLARALGGDTAACVGSDGAPRCSGANLFDLASVAGSLDDSARRGEPVVVVDEAGGSLLVVSSDPVATVLALPADALIDQRAANSISEFGADVDVSLLGATVGAVGPTDPSTIEGRRVVTDIVGVAGGGGAILVTSSTADDAGFVGDGLALYLVLLVLGTVLMALAGWTFLLDRRALERRATTDELTGLVNRREFERVALESLLAADRFEHGICVMLIDLNGFKQINDTLGHQFGDLVLEAAAERLRSAVRDTDVVARWGGDEFVILLPGIEDGTAVRASAERIGRSLAATPIVRDVTITGAIGAALFPRHGTDLAALISAADIAMYSAKSAGVVYRLADAHTVELAEEELRSGQRGRDRRRQGDRVDAVSLD